MARIDKAAHSIELTLKKWFDLIQVRFISNCTSLQVEPLPKQCLSIQTLLVLIQAAGRLTLRELVNYLRRLMNLAHCSPLTDEEVDLLFRWFDPKGLGAVSKEDMATRIDGYCEQGGVRGMCVVVH